MRTYKPTGRPRGAPKGNRNAIKHGIYARRYTRAQRKQLNAMPPLDSLSEIHMLRTQLNDILTLLAATEDPELRVKLYNTLFTGIQRLLSAMRTRSKILGTGKSHIDEMYEAAAVYGKEFGIDMPLLEGWEPALITENADLSPKNTVGPLKRGK